MKKGRISALLAAGAMLAGGMVCFPAAAEASARSLEGTYDDMTYRNYGDYIEITGCDTNAAEAVIPEEIDGIPVTTIASQAFNGCISLTSVTIPETVTSIGQYAFMQCISLTDIRLPSGIDKIMHGTFFGCRSLTVLDIPDSVMSVGPDAFYTSGLVDPGESLQYVDNWLVEADSDISEIVLQEGTVGIADDLFYGSTALCTVDLPDSLRCIGSRAFYDCTELTSFDIPDSVVFIGAVAFKGTPLLEEQTGVKYIGNWVIDADADITSAVLKDGTYGIAVNAFSLCNTLMDITIPDSVLYINHSVFSGCTSLSDVYFSGDETAWSAVSIADYNDPLLAANLHFGSADSTGSTDTIAPVSVVYGDVNTDGSVDILDVIALNKSLLAGEILTEQGILNADADKDGIPTSADSLFILKYTINLVESLD